MDSRPATDQGTARPSVNDKEYHPTKLRGRLADAFKEISALNARVGELSAENSELKFKIKVVDNELKDTRAILGQAVVNANRQASSKTQCLPCLT